MKQQGFTLIELMIVVMIVAVLAAIAYPSYSNHVRKTARKEAASIMLDMAGRMERIRSQTFTYQDIDDQTTPRYTVAVGIVDGGKGFTVTATPSGDQQEDPCGTVVLDHQGGWTFTKNSTVVLESSCK